MTAQQRNAAGLVAAIVAVGGVLALVVVPGGSSSSGGESAGTGGSATSSVAMAPARGPGLASGSVNGAAANAPGKVSPADDRVGSSATATRVVRNGQLSLQVSSVTTAVSRLTALATSAGGYVQSSATSTDSGTPQGDITLLPEALRPGEVELEDGASLHADAIVIATGLAARTLRSRSSSLTWSSTIVCSSVNQSA